jgi:hypothetical protein
MNFSVGQAGPLNSVLTEKCLAGTEARPTGILTNFPKKVSVVQVVLLEIVGVAQVAGIIRPWR